jgi:hypothetical protein
MEAGMEIETGWSKVGSVLGYILCFGLLGWFAYFGWGFVLQVVVVYTDAQFGAQAGSVRLIAATVIIGLLVLLAAYLLIRGDWKKLGGLLSTLFVTGTFVYLALALWRDAAQISRTLDALFGAHAGVARLVAVAMAIGLLVLLAYLFFRGERNRLGGLIFRLLMTFVLGAGGLRMINDAVTYDVMAIRVVYILSAVPFLLAACWFARGAYEGARGTRRSRPNDLLGAAVVIGLVALAGQIVLDLVVLKLFPHTLEVSLVLRPLMLCGLVLLGALAYWRFWFQRGEARS